MIRNPDKDRISTSYVERQNLTMRMSMRRFTLLTNAFSKQFEDHCHSQALYFVHYNWCRPHKTLRSHTRPHPAMAAGIVPCASRFPRMPTTHSFHSVPILLQKPFFRSLLDHATVLGVTYPSVCKSTIAVCRSHHSLASLILAHSA